MERQKFSFTAEERLQRQGQASATDIADLIVIGASAGGHRALREILGNFSTEIPATIVILLHQVLNSPGSLNKTLGQFSRLP